MILDQLPHSGRASASNREKGFRSSSLKPSSSKRNKGQNHSRYATKVADNLSEPDEAEKIVYNTYFDAPPGEDNGEVEVEASVVDYYEDENLLGNKRDKAKDYEEILEDSPLNSQTNIDECEYPAYLVNSVNIGAENVDELIDNIQELYKKVPQTKKTNHKRGISHAQGPKKPQKPKKFFHQSSLMIDSPLDLDSIYATQSEKSTTRKFSKLDESSIKNMYTKLKNCKSSLSTSLHESDPTLTQEKPTQQGRNTVKKKNIRTFRVYFFNTKLYLDIPINTSLTVGEVIRQIMDYYLQDKTVDPSLLKYPKDFEAYELRMLDDEDADCEDAHLPDLSLPPLEKNRVFSSLGLEKGVAFVENTDYRPPLENNDKGAIKFMEKIANEKKKIIVTIHGDREQFKTTFPIEPAKKIKDLYPRIAVKVKVAIQTNQFFKFYKKISERYHKFRLYKKERAQYERDYKDEDDEDENDEGILDDNLPLKELKTYNPGTLELEVVRKRFLDDPPQDPLFLKSSLFGTNEIDPEEQNYIRGSESHGVPICNDVMASQYEEFEVQKVKEKGKKVNRIIGIDGVKIYNLFRRKEQDLGLSNVFSNLFFTKIAPKNPERPLLEVNEAKMSSENKFSIKFRIEANKTKVVTYEAVDFKTAYKIVSKIQYLK